MAYPFLLSKLLIRTGLARYLSRAGPWMADANPFLHYYSDRVLATPQRQLVQAASFVEAHGPDTIDLALGAPLFDLVPSGTTKLPADRRGWPPVGGVPELRAAVADRLREAHDLDVDAVEEVLITPGAGGAFNTALDALVNPGEAVVLFDPSSPLYSPTLRQRRVRIRWVHAWTEDGRIRFRLDHLKRAMRRARLIVLCSPNNPTGGAFQADDLEQIVRWAQRHDVLILSDESFADYHYDGEHASIGTLPNARARTLTLGSLSKSHALASARVGWLAGHRHLVQACALTAALQSPFVPTVCQQIALTALRQPREACARIREEFDSRRRYAFERLQAMELRAGWPAGAFFLWVPVWDLGYSGCQFAMALLREKNVLVTPGEFFGPSGIGYVRISYATDDGRLREGLSRLAEFLRDAPTTEASQVKRLAA